MTASPLIARDDDLSLFLKKGTDQGMDRPRTEKGLIAQDDQDSLVPGVCGLDPFSDRRAHALPIIGIEHHLDPASSKRGPKI